MYSRCKAYHQFCSENSLQGRCCTENSVAFIKIILQATSIILSGNKFKAREIKTTFPHSTTFPHFLNGW